MKFDIGKAYSIGDPCPRCGLKAILFRVALRIPQTMDLTVGEYDRLRSDMAICPSCVEELQFQGRIDDTPSNVP